MQSMTAAEQTARWCALLFKASSAADNPSGPTAAPRALAGAPHPVGSARSLSAPAVSPLALHGDGPCKLAAYNVPIRTRGTATCSRRAVPQRARESPSRKGGAGAAARNVLCVARRLKGVRCLPHDRCTLYGVLPARFGFRAGCARAAVFGGHVHSRVARRRLLELLVLAP